MNSLVVYCADIGSIKHNNFGWAREKEGDTDISHLVTSVATDLNERKKVALGFECPLYVPISADPNHLTSQRAVEKGRPWSAGAGAAVLATGLTETVWILLELRKRIESPLPAFLTWQDFSNAEQGLFLWEAMVTGQAKGTSHRQDATIAVRAFRAQISQAAAENRDKGGSVHSLIGAALLRTGWSEDLSLLGKPCLVIRA